MAERPGLDPLTVDTNAEYFIRTPESSPNSTSSDLSLKKDVLGFGALSDYNPSATVDIERCQSQDVHSDRPGGLSGRILTGG